MELESLLEPLPARRETGGHRDAHHLLVKVFAEPFVGAGSLLAGDDDLAREGVGLPSKLVLGVEHIHVHKTVTATEQILVECSGSGRHHPGPP